MDPFTQRMLEKAEQRSRALGISNAAASKFPLSECSGGGDASSNFGSAGVISMASQQQTHMQLRSPATSSTHASTNTSGINKLQVVERQTPMESTNTGSPHKVLRQFSAIDKENMDLGIEINIMTDKHVEVQVQVEEQDITDDEASQPLIKTHAHEAAVNQPLAKIRDTSRNRLQRLGALYSNTDDLSSPIHRTEGQFHAGDDNALERSSRKPKKTYGKLMELANSINQWEDDSASTHHQQINAVVPPPPKPDLPSRRVCATTTPGTKKQQAPAPPAPIQTKVNEKVTQDNQNANNKTKQLKWDPKVINSLEAQGFQRRESSSVKLAYDYGKDEEDKEKQQNLNEKQPTASVAVDKPSVGKLASTFNVASQEEKKSEKKLPNVKPGLVSGRAAVFEHKASSSQQLQRPQKDPTELTMKERMQLFEKNKGEALVPKAAFGMAPSISKIRQDAHNAAAQAHAQAQAKKDETKVATSVAPASVKPSADSKVRDKVAALVASATTISENKIKADITKQRQEDMQLLANRFHKQKEIFSKETTSTTTALKDVDVRVKSATSQSQVRATTAALKNVCTTVRPPPPPPPPPMHSGKTSTLTNAASSKRRSPGDAIDDESKRARKSNTAVNRLYPALSDLETNDDSVSDNDNCGTTATASARSTADEHREHDDDDNDNDSYMEDESEENVDDEDSSVGICNGSLGREIMQVVQKNEHHQQQQKPKQIKEVRYADKDHYYGGDSSMNSSEASMGIDDYLDEALDENNDDGDDDYTQEESAEEDDENTSRASRGSKGTTASNSFSFRKTPSKYINCETITEEHDDFHTPTTSHSASANASKFAQPVKSELSVINQENDNMVTLVHTVSFYRRQQSANSANSTPVRKICREQQVYRSDVDGAATATMHFESPQTHNTETHQENYSDEDDLQSDSDADDTQLVQEKIKKLLDEVCKQQQVIAQTSQALNLCAATIEFSGSTESVEGERHLLVATHRRQACLDEVQRLRVEKSLRPVGAPKEKGRLTVKEITVPLRQDYIRKLAADTISGHHLVCLLKYNEHVLATKTVPTLPGLLAVKFPDVLILNNVYADFRITLEIYGMTAQREVLPHEVKYHINLSKKSGIKTPKKKGSDNRLVMPPVQSPAGPHVVRTPALVQYGFAIFSLREIQRTNWTLTQVLGVSPLDGAVHMKVNCELSVSVEYKGFLTMFEDISGFGAWHRRWCHLNGTMLNYWKYPDDEKKKAPMGTIDLYACSSQKVATAPRDICARLNTMLLECQRLAKDSDQESLIIVPNGRTTIVRHLLSADTKDEREEWSAYFNKALTLLRAWGPPQ